MSSLHFLTKIQATHPLESFLEKWFIIGELHVMWFSSYNISPFVNLLALLIVHDDFFESLLYPLITIFYVIIIIKKRNLGFIYITGKTWSFLE
jgi:hypothetical protein